MTSNPHLQQILKEQKSAFLTFDQNLLLKDFNLKYTSFFSIQNPRKYKQTVWDIFPELVGAEDIIQQILTGKKKKHTIEGINKIDEKNKIKYFDLSFSRISKPGVAPNLFCIINDVTVNTALEQQIRQKKYEFAIVQSQTSKQNYLFPDNLLGRSSAIEKIKEFIKKVSVHNTNVLLQGESGTGKSIAAKIIHTSSGNPKAPFIEINCAAIPPTLLESELFGYEKGAFTNAVADKKGLLQEADGGTLFLDEIGELPLSLQAKLLTFLETKRYRPLGSVIEQTVNLRLIAATNKDLAEAAHRNEFRQDLYYRINVVSTTLPPLRELKEDIILLALHFIEILNFEFKKNVTGLSDSSRRKLLQHNWPGNTRELKNTIERAMIFVSGNQIDASDLLINSGHSLRIEKNSANVPLPNEGISLKDVEKNLILEALKKTNGNQSKSAALLGLSFDTFRYRLKKFNISPKQFR